MGIIEISTIVVNLLVSRVCDLCKKFSKPNLEDEASKYYHFTT